MNSTNGTGWDDSSFTVRAIVAYCLRWLFSYDGFIHSMTLFYTASLATLYFLYRVTCTAWTWLCWYLCRLYTHTWTKIDQLVAWLLALIL